MSFKDKVLVNLVEVLGASLIRLFGYSWRIRWINRHIYQECKEQYGAVIYAFWHCQMLIPSFTHRRQDVRILISQSKDGEFIARTVSNLGFVPIRGSSSRRGLKALFEMVNDGKAGHDVAITPDGPRGPRYQAQIGVVLLAQRSGLPIIPCGFAAQKRWELNTWDRFCIPRFFSPVQLVYGQPICVDQDCSGDQLEEKRSDIEQAMLRTQAISEQFD